MIRLPALLAACLITLAAQAETPTQANVAYGKHPKQVLDFYKTDSAMPAPLLFFIHGGGWMSGDKANPDFLANCLKSGISMVSINYRLIPEAQADGVSPPVKGCLGDCARALQFVRSKAAEWNIDKTRIGGCGGSAGGFNVLWLAFHPDLAKPASTDPVERESTHLRCAMTFVPQTSLDPTQMKEWIPNNNYGHHAFLLPKYEDFIAKRQELLPFINEFSPYVLATKAAPPVYLFYDTAPAMGKEAKDPPHSANFGLGLAEKLRTLGVKFEFNYPGSKEVRHPDIFSFITEELKGPAAGGK